jgi:hypothetical protein
MTRTKKNSKRRGQRRNDDSSIPRQLGAVAGAGRITRRVITIIGDLSTNVAGYIPSASAFSSANAFSASDFASLANLFTSYRVVSMEVVFMPVTNVNTTTNIEVGTFVSCEWNGGTSPATYQAICDGANFQPRDGRYIVKISCKNRQLQNKNWTSITSSVTGTDTFGIAYGCPQTGRGVTGTTQWCRYVQRMLCEFQYAG